MRQILLGLVAREARPALVAEGLRIGGRDLAFLARNFALHLWQRGVRQGAVVALRSDDVVVSLCAVLATGMLGARFALAGEAEAANMVLDTAPEGQLLPGAVLVDQSWAGAPMAEAAGMFPGPMAAETPWLILPGASGASALSEADLAALVRAEAGSFQRQGTGVVVLAGPEEPEALLWALITLYHGGALVESADPRLWRAEGVSLVIGRVETVAACLQALPEEAKFQDLVLWDEPAPRADDPLRALFAQVRQVQLLAPVPEPVPFALLDRLFEAIDGVAGAACFMVPKAGQGERLTAFLVLKPGADWPVVSSEAGIAALRLGGKSMVPKRFLPIDDLPRLPDGSPDRAACRAQVLAGRQARKRRAAATGSAG